MKTLYEQAGLASHQLIFWPLIPFHSIRLLFLWYLALYYPDYPTVLFPLPPFHFLSMFTPFITALIV